VATRTEAATPTYGRRPFAATRQTAYAYAYILPGFLFITSATLIGVGYSLYISFTNYDGLTHFDEWDWVGLDNYRDVLFGVDLGTFVMVMQWTLVFAVLSTLLSFVIGLGLALLLNDREIPERSVYRTLLIVPWALPATISILAWSGIFNDDFGYMNHFLDTIGLGAVPWLSDAFWAKVSILIMNTWLAYPFMMTACLGALQAIPDELNEAAVVDGAGALSRFRFVTLPYLRSVITPLLIGTFAYQFNNFNVVYLLTAGNPAVENSDAGGTDILISYTYKLTLVQQQFAVAAAYTVVIFLLVATISAFQMKLSRAFEEAH
jgi:arabinogalactan oligomer / maltooligosaccharide transport system permease protein